MICIMYVTTLRDNMAIYNSLKNCYIHGQFLRQHKLDSSDYNALKLNITNSGYTPLT